MRFAASEIILLARRMLRFRPVRRVMFSMMEERA